MQSGILIKIDKMQKLMKYVQKFSNHCKKNKKDYMKKKWGDKKNLKKQKKKENYKKL